jgi:hypothetical protein
MKILRSRDSPAGERSQSLVKLLETISQAQLREFVNHIAHPRHFVAEPKQNRATGDWLISVFRSFGYEANQQGQHNNIVALPKERSSEMVLVGAHYDSVAQSPGADDNASAVAAMLSCAAACSLWRPCLPVAFVAFNREEESLIGSRDFIASCIPGASYKIQCAHILEMVGFASSEPNSQRVPPGLPIDPGDKGDFLGLLANDSSVHSMEDVLPHASTYTPGLPVLALNIKPGLEKLLPVLARSDHAPFWDHDIPAVMWTDTAEFRNHNYHRPTDTPDTLNYSFLQKVTQLLTATLVLASSISPPR